ncbi:ATPase [Methylobacterium sp. Leaf125]|uniref:AAA family ATPase n=1 Tax=Methylobacterium sp. Leaf125 TaxID=1736265 RepID=UPI0006FCAC8C|nr:AAA family ATPase [Methylobacterium sp. Leaf125]KQQ39209.1 ATPase [Methylobacterium sp. Leaf125]
MLAVRDVAVSGYRSLHAIRFPLGSLSVFIGANGVGKTNLYRVLEYLQSAATDTLIRNLVAEGSLDSVSWAGARKVHESARIRWSVELADNVSGLAYDYAVEVGCKPPVAAAGFPLEPELKTERLRLISARRPATLLHRDGPGGFLRDGEGRKRSLGGDLLPSETVLGTVQDGGSYPDLHQVRSALAAWRFHHDVRTDAGSALRRPCLAVTTPTLSSDGSDLAAVFATLAHIRQDTVDLAAAVDDAFPGARLDLPVPGRQAQFGMVFPDYPKRVFAAAELSDGTLRFLALAGALLAYRLPPFMALNEPETSLHPDLLAPLARLIVKASARTQVWLVTHSERLADAILAEGGTRPHRVIQREGATWIEGLKLFGAFAEDD